MSLHHRAPVGTAAHPRRWTALVLLCLAEFMLILDATAANVALPTIGRELSLGRTGLTWVVTAYVLAFGGLMLLGGRLADTLGRNRVLYAGVALFTLGSLVCGLTDSGAVLIAARAVQGVGAALVAPAALSTITTMFAGEERNRALGAWAAIGGAGFVVGMIVSGLLTAGPGWRWVFFVNVPLGIAALVVLPALLPRPPPGRRARSGSTSPARCSSPPRPPRSSTASPKPAMAAGPLPAPCCRSPPRSCSGRPSSRSSAGSPTRSCASGSSPSARSCPACSSCSWPAG